MPHVYHKAIELLLATSQSLGQILGITLGMTMSMPAVTANAQELDIMAVYEEKQREIATMMEGATVFILTMDKKGDCISMGSGFIVADGYVMTNAHVIEEGKTFYALNASLKATKATLVKKEASSTSGVADFALLRLADAPKLPILLFNTNVKRMDRVSAWGFPYLVTQYDENLAQALKGNLSKVPPVVYTEGTVNAIVRQGKGINIIHGAAIAAGNSGGPLVNARGEVVGINTWGAKEKDEGAFVNAALTADSMIRFLTGCGISPLLSRRTPLGMSTANGGNGPGSTSGNLTPSPSRPQSRSLAPAGQWASALTPAQKPTPSELHAENDTTLPSSITNSQLYALAQHGEADAQYQLGYTLFYGEGVDVNEKEALYWLTQSAEQGHIEASGTLGVLYILAEKDNDVNKGLELIEEAAKTEVYFSAIIGLMLYQGEGYGVPRNIDRALYHAKRGAESGFPDSLALLGMLYFYGEGVDRDIKKSYDLAVRAIEGDSMLGQSLMAWMFYSGDGVEEDTKKAFVMAQDAAEASQGSAMGLLALLYYTGDGVTEDDIKALEWAERASDAGNEFGHFVLGCLYADGSVTKKDLPKAFAYAKLAQDYGVSMADEILETISHDMSSSQKQAGEAEYRAWHDARGIEFE